MGNDVTDIHVSLGDGIRVETDSLGTIVFDAGKPTGDLNVVSHAHTDHLPRNVTDTEIICSDLTARLAIERRNLTALQRTSHPAIELLPAGHIDGSRAALIDDNGCRILFTGDVCTRDRPGIRGFAPVPADILIIEATYGNPTYRFPSVDQVTDEILEWIDNATKPIVMFGYSLGRAQRILRILEPHVDRPVKTTKTIQSMNKVIAESTDYTFETDRFDSEQQLEEGDLLLAAGIRAAGEEVRRMLEKSEALAAGFTGWAIERSYRYRRSVDRGFVLSDHCDFDELIALVDEVDPEVVYTHHGFTKELARELTKCGFDARALEKHQSTIQSFA